MKNKMFFLLIFLISIYSISYVWAINLPLYNKIIYLDPGHGGNDPGAIGNNIYEKDINLEIAYTLKHVLEQNGAKVYLTRDKDTDLASIYAKNKKLSDLSKRVNMINNSDADIYLSIHLNADKIKSLSGPQVFYHNKNINNKQLANVIQKNLNKELKTNRKIKLIKDRYLYRNITKNGVLLELGFITNSNEIKNLLKQEYQLKLANIIKDSLIEYFN